MSAMTLLIIIGIIVALAMLSATYVITYIIGKRTARNNPDNGLVMIKNGSDIPSYKAKCIQKTRLGRRYRYNKDKTVIVPNKYTPEYNNYRRLIWLSVSGQVIATPFDKDEKLSDSEREDLIYEMFETHVGSDGMRALKSKTSTMNIVIVAIIAVLIGAIATFGVIQFQKSMAVKQQAIDSQKQSQEAENPDEDKPELPEFEEVK